MMCAEAVPMALSSLADRRCLVGWGIRSEEIVNPPRTQAHVLTSFAKVMPQGSFIRNFLDASNDNVAGYIIPFTGQSSHSHSCERKKSTEV
jgi:hypothetical protein